MKVLVIYDPCSGTQRRLPRRSLTLFAKVGVELLQAGI
jgi:hypothetical protein